MPEEQSAGRHFGMHCHVRSEGVTFPTWRNIRTWPGLCRLAHDTAGGKAGDREQPGVLGLCRRIRRTKTQFPQSDQFDVKAPPSVNQTITASQNVYERDVKPYVEINSCVRLLVSHRSSEKLHTQAVGCHYLRRKQSLQLAFRADSAESRGYVVPVHRLVGPCNRRRITCL